MAQDTFELTSSLIKGVNDREAKATANDKKLAHSKLIETSISPLYQRYIGSHITIAYNGNFMKLPVDGSKVYLSKGHYDALQKYIRHIDRNIKISQQNSKFMGQQVTGDFRHI